MRGLGSVRKENGRFCPKNVGETSDTPLAVLTKSTTSHRLLPAAQAQKQPKFGRPQPETSI